MSFFRFAASSRLSQGRSFKRSFSNSVDNHLKGKVALVTGSTSGIGLGIARSFAAKGSSLVLNGFGNQTEINLIKKQLENEFKIQVEYHGADMSKPKEIQDLVIFVNSRFGGVDILVNNAGIQHVAPVHEFPDEKWEQVISINLSSAFYTTKGFLPHMLEKKWGRIINVASVHGLVGSVNKSAYVASKHAIVGLTKVVALETAGTGVTVNCINPGWVKTPLVEMQIKAKAESLGISFEEATSNLLEEKQPSKQFVTVEQLGETALFLCSNAASQITGISIPVDGGWTSR